MKFFLVTGIILILVLSLFSTVLADELNSANNTTEKVWNGTWTDVNYTLLIEQKGLEVTAIGRSYNIGLNDPFLLSGTISEDGKSLNGIKKETGTLEMYLSDDNMSFSANGTVDPVDNESELYNYKTKGNRNGTSIIPDSIWGGVWNTGNTSLNINQSGNSVIGDYYPLLSPEHGGVFEGMVSDDGKTLSTKWTYTENVTFILSDDGMFLIESDCGEKEKAAGEVCLNLTKKE
jgi:hypothetical protein